MVSEEAWVWVSRPPEVGDEQMRSLELLLDAGEIERASKFRFESDRRAYVVAHGVRRIALGDFLEVDPARVVLAKQSSGKPVLIWPGNRKVFFSHAHTREVVAIAVASVGPVGIDVECLVQTRPDFELLAAFVVLPEASQRVEELGIDPAAQFFFYWTALEAFWKAAGKGLSQQNPRICCEKTGAGTFEITLEGDAGTRDWSPRATVSRIQSSEDCVISLARQHPHNTTGPASAASPYRINKCRKKDDIFQRSRRYHGNGFISIVLV